VATAPAPTAMAWATPGTAPGRRRRCGRGSLTPWSLRLWASGDRQGAANRAAPVRPDESVRAWWTAAMEAGCAGLPRAHRRHRL